MPWPTDEEPDDELFAITDRELERQNTTLQLIASENFASPAVLRATGSVLTNKYSEGYPGKRYYGGNSFIDEAEDLARTRVKQLFGAEHANVQPHSGANANMAVYLAFLQPGDTVMGLSLDHGGHLTHGSPANASGKLYRFVSYKLSPSDERIDMDAVRDLAIEHRPKMIVTGATAYPRRIDSEPCAGHRRRGRCPVRVRRRPHRRTHRGWRAPEPRSVRRHRHPHDAQDAARSARWLHPLEGRARRSHRQGDLPRPAGWPARARDRGQGGGVQGSDAPVVSRSTRPRSCATRRRWRRDWRPRASAWCRAVPTITSCSSTCATSMPT